MNHSPISEEAVRDMITRLQRNPELFEQVQALLEEVENSAGKLNTGDEAEEAIVARIRQMGRQALTGWAERRHAAVQPAQAQGQRRVGKKNFIGRQLSEL